LILYEKLNKMGAKYSKILYDTLSDMTQDELEKMIEPRILIGCVDEIDRILEELTAQLVYNTRRFKSFKGWVCDQAVIYQSCIVQCEFLISIILRIRKETLIFKEFLKPTPMQNCINYTEELEQEHRNARELVRITGWKKFSRRPPLDDNPESMEPSLCVKCISSLIIRMI